MTALEEFMRRLPKPEMGLFARENRVGRAGAAGGHGTTGSPKGVWRCGQQDRTRSAKESANRARSAIGSSDVLDGSRSFSWSQFKLHFNHITHRRVGAFLHRLVEHHVVRTIAVREDGGLDWKPIHFSDH
ncbi:MAG: hypothetical protein M5U20_09335 [Phycisphaerales bacterium]|nr:hypothetical protein [Phycisphaerales bacterium]